MGLDVNFKPRKLVVLSFSEPIPGEMILKNIEKLNEYSRRAFRELFFAIIHYPLETVLRNKNKRLKSSNYHIEWVCSVIILNH